MDEEKRKISIGTVWKILIVSGIIIFASLYIVMSYADEETTTGEFITANKVYMPDNNIKLVIYFNGTNDNINFKIFDSWNARHSILLSNMNNGDRVKIYYKEYVFRSCKEIVRVELL